MTTVRSSSTPGTGRSTFTRVLEASGLCAGYDAQPVVRDLDINVDAGEVVVLLGANGAGKTTTLLALAGELPVMKGSVTMWGKRMMKAPLHARARDGLGLVTDKRSMFTTLSTRDNLRAANVRAGEALALFPELEPRFDVRAGLLSGGEQQMLSLACALCRRPRLLLVDELSLGLAPLIVRRLLEVVRRAADDHGMGVLLVEQHARKALRYADRGYVMRRGRLVTQGSGRELRTRLSEIEDHYLTTSEGVGASADDTPSAKPKEGPK